MVDVIFKTTQNDRLIEINSYRNETLAKAEKELTYGTEDTDLDPSLPMSLEEMNCGRISPIQAKDVCRVIDGETMLRPKLTGKKDTGIDPSPFMSLEEMNCGRISPIQAKDVCRVIDGETMLRPKLTGKKDTGIDPSPFMSLEEMNCGRISPIQAKDVCRVIDGETMLRPKLTGKKDTGIDPSPFMSLEEMNCGRISPIQAKDVCRVIDGETMLRPKLTGKKDTGIDPSPFMSLEEMNCGRISPIQAKDVCRVIDGETMLRPKLTGKKDTGIDPSPFMSLEEMNCGRISPIQAKDVCRVIDGETMLRPKLTGKKDTGIDPSPFMSLEEMNCGRISPIQAKDVCRVIDGETMLRPKLTGKKDTGIDPSPFMSLEEMNCGRISPIQAKDVCRVIDGETMLRPKLTNIELKENEFEEILNPSIGLMSHSACQFWQGPSCSHDQYAASTILEKHYTEEPRSHHEYSSMIDGDPNNLTNIFRERMSSKLYKKSTVKENHNDISQKKSIKFSRYLSNHKMLNISCPEKQFNAHFMYKDAEIDISNQSGEISNDEVISDETEMPITLGDGVTYDRSTVASGVDSFSGLSWRIDSENNTGKEYFESSCYQGELLPKGAPRRSLWDNVRKVYLPDSSSYVKSHDNAGPKFLSVLLNSNQNSGCERLLKNDSYDSNLTSNLRKCESLYMVKKPIGNSRAEVEKNDKVSAIPFVKGLVSPKKLLQLPLKREEIGSTSRENEFKTDEVRELNSWDNHNGKIQAISKKEIQNKELDEMKIEAKSNLEGHFETEERVQLRLCKKLENVVVEEPPSHILPGMKPFGTENLDGTENHDVSTSSKNKMGIAEDAQCDCEKLESATKEVVVGELNAPKEIGKDTKDNDNMSISMEEITFRKDIDKLVDDILAEREVEFLSEENLFVRIDVNVDKTFGEVEDERMKIPAEVCSSKVVVEENVQCTLSMEDTKYVNSQKSAQVSHFKMTETDNEKIIRANEEKAAFQVRNEERNSYAETENICVKGVEMAETVEVGKIVDLENVQMKNILTGIQTEKVQEFGGEFNELRDVELKFTDEKIKGRKLQTLDACTELKYNVKEDVGQSSNHDNGVQNTLVSVPFKSGKSLDSEKTAMGDGGDSIDIKEKEVDTSVYPHETESRVRIFEGADELRLLAVKDDIICNHEQSIQDKSIAIPSANIETDCKETKSPKDEITKKWKYSNDGGSSEVEEGNTEEFSLNSRSMENNEVNEKVLSDLIEGKNMSTNGEIDCEGEEIFLPASDYKCIEDECVTSKRETKGDCTVENHSFFHPVEILSARSKDLINDRENNAGINHELVVISADETINNGKANILEVTSFQNAENGCFISMEDKNDDSKAHSMEEKDALNDFLENENSSANEKCDTMKHLVEEPVTSLLPNEPEISNSTNMSEVRNEVCHSKLVNFLPLHHQSSASCVEIDTLEENEAVDGNKSLNLSNINKLCKMDVVFKNCAVENHRVFEVQDALDPEKNSANDQLDLFTGKCSLNESMQLSKITLVKDSADIDKSKDECYSSQRGEDYMISGVELSKNHPINDYECLGSQNKILYPLEIDSREGSIAIVERDMGSMSMSTIERGSMKFSSEIFPMEFDGIEKLSDFQPNNLILDESNVEDKDLNIVMDSESFGESKQLSNTSKSQSQVRPECTPKDAPFFYACPTSSFTNVGAEGKSKDGKSLDLSSLPTNCHEITCVTSCIKNEIHQNLNPDDSVTNPPNFTNQNKSIGGGMSERNSGINYDSVEKVFESKLNDEFVKADFYHEKLVDVKSGGPLVHGIYELNQEEIVNEIGRVSPKYASYDLEGALMNEEKNDHQIVPDGIETQNIMASDLMASEKGQILSGEQGKIKSESKGNSIVTESSSFSLDSYLDSLVDKQLLFENKGDLMSGTTYHSCSQSADASCQTQLCGLLNTVHSCRCLETHLLSDGELENLKLKGRKRTLQALNLEGLHLRNKRFKLLGEANYPDISPDEVFVKDEPPLKIDCALNNQSDWIKSNTNTVTENVANDFGSELTTKGPTHPVKLHENEWEELEEVQLEQVEIKEVCDQKVPDVAFHQDRLAVALQMLDLQTNRVNLQESRAMAENVSGNIDLNSLVEQLFAD
ncbi:uncharacterized protein [Hetaerina americana]|uniref:uncharacterized protein n=1 Tax=Hetaerina americana TaxID=62018 RepID=UPI003A7F24A8